MTRRPAQDRDQILDMWESGLKGADIAGRLGRHPTAVRAIVKAARDRGDARAVRRGQARLPSSAKPVTKILYAEARRRGMTLIEIKRAILAAVANDNLFAAVLDP